MAQVVKNVPANEGDLGSILGSGKPLETEMATQSNIPACEIQWTKEPGKLRSMGSRKSRTLLGG